jgi:phosphinothricin acetyltransferase
MQLAECTPQAHSEAILRILNDVIANSTALFDYKARSPESMAGWFATKTEGRFPVIGAFEEGELLGFATYGVFRAWPAYKYTVEHSVYVASGRRGQGVGRALLTALVSAAEGQEYHTMVAGIVSSNVESIALHKRLGFQYCGTVREAGFKFGRWLDLDLYQLLLPTPAAPVDG